MDFYKLYRKAGFFNDTLASYLEVTPQTIKRWTKSNKAPKAVIKLLQILNNDLSHLGKEWEGFYFYNGALHTTENEHITPGKLRALPYYIMTIDFLKREKSGRSEKAVFSNSNKIISFKKS